MSLIEMNIEYVTMPYMGSAEYLPVAPIAVRIMPSNEGEHRLLVIAKHLNWHSSLAIVDHGTIGLHLKLMFYAYFKPISISLGDADTAEICIKFVWIFVFETLTYPSKIKMMTIFQIFVLFFKVT